MTSTERGNGSSAEAVWVCKDANRQQIVAATEHMPRLQIWRAAVGGAKWVQRTAMASWFARSSYSQQALCVFPPKRAHFRARLQGIDRSLFLPVLAFDDVLARVFFRIHRAIGG